MSTPADAPHESAYEVPFQAARQAPPISRILIFGGKDPAPGPNQSKTWSRNLDCERLTAETGSRLYPGEIKPPIPRGANLERATVVCRERMLRAGLRSALDEALLSELQVTSVALAETAASVRPDLADATWLVEVYVPSPSVGAKVGFATKNALMSRGLRVSDRTPVLGFGDLDVITRMPADEAYPTACLRYFATGSLAEGDALLAVVTRDPRETILHAGLCAEGEWTWLR